MNTLHIKTGDTVVILSGNEKGKTGKVLKTFPKDGLVLVEGVGMHTKHQKPRREGQKGQKGQIIEKHLPIRASKVLNVEAKKGAATKKKAARAKK